MSTLDYSMYLRIKMNLWDAPSGNLDDVLLLMA